MIIEDEKGNQYQGNYETLFSVYQKQESIQIKSSATSIYGEAEDKNAFYTCRSIKNVYFESGSHLQTIGNFAFFKCFALRSLDLSVCSELASIGDSAFKEATSLESISLPQGLRTMGRECFSLSGLTTLEIPNTVISIGNLFAMYCYNLTTVVFATGINLQSIPDSSFARSGLTSFDVPPSVTNINYYALHGNKYIKTITADNNTKYRVFNGILCDIGKTETVACPGSLSLEKVIIPDDIVTVEKCSFHSCQAKSVTIGSGVKYIKTDAFRDSLIESIELPNSVVYCDSRSFEGCKNLSTVTLSDIMQTLFSRSFRATSIETITIPSSVTTIENLCFFECANLKTVVIPSTVTTLGGGIFAGCPNIQLSFAPGSPFKLESDLVTSDSYKYVHQYVGKNADSVVTIPSTVIEIKVAAFQMNDNVVEVNFANSQSQLASILYDAFKSCVNLKKFSFPSTLKTINDNAFYRSGIQEVIFNSDMTSISEGAFMNCPDLTNVQFTVPVTSLDLQNKAFMNCSKLRSITLPSGLTIINEYLLYNATQLTTVVIPSSVTTINQYAFSCTGLTSVTFSETQNSLETIGNRAFYNSESLSAFPFSEGLKTIDTYAFANTGFQNIKMPNSIVNLNNGCFSECTKLVEADIARVESSQLNHIGFGILQGCLKLKNIVCENNKKFTINNCALYDIGFTNIYAFPPASKPHFIYLPATVKVINAGTFHSCANIYTVLIPDDSQLEVIGTVAFAGCSELRSVNFPKNIKTVGVDSFIGCNKLACGIVVENPSKNFRKYLVEVAKMPKRCMMECDIYQSAAICHNVYIKSSIFFLTSLIFYI